MRLTVPSHYARTQICGFLVPAALEEPGLLYAIMTFAAIHLEATGRLLDNSERMISSFQSISTRHLRLLLANESHGSRAIALATARTLCQAQIYGGTSSWRIHLNGAKAILESSHFKDRRGDSCACSSSSAGFLSSWFNNAEALAALSPTGLLQGQFEALCYSNTRLFFDVFGGVMSDLPDLFREVGALVQEARRQYDKSASDVPILSETDIAQEAEGLVREIHYRVERDSLKNLAFNQEMLAALSMTDIQDYALSNAGFLYTALLYVHCGVQQLSPMTEEVQICVEHIISCSRCMTRSLGLSPRVLLIAPLFTAGVCAVGSAQDAIRSALIGIGEWMRTPNLEKTLALLEHIWQQPQGNTQNTAWSHFGKFKSQSSI